MDSSQGQDTQVLYEYNLRPTEPCTVKGVILTRHRAVKFTSHHSFKYCTAVFLSISFYIIIFESSLIKIVLVGVKE